MNITEKQMEAYNDRDLNKFLSYYADDYKAFILETGQMITDGKKQLTEIISGSFEKMKDASSVVLNSITQGDLIINQEETTGHIPDKKITSITIYEVIDDIIMKMWFGGRVIEDYP